jgi:hypothetical protein
MHLPNIRLSPFLSLFGDKSNRNYPKLIPQLFAENYCKIMQEQIPIQTLSLFPLLDQKLLELLNSLTEDEWNSQTVAKLWRVKDVAAHLLDGNLRGLSISRDRFYGENPENIRSYGDLVAFLNHLNMSWTSAMKRLSPKALTFLLEVTGQQYTEHLNTLAPFDNAVFPVAWAGQETSANWFHIAREYTEKFLHQQQIRDAVGKPALFTKELYYPFIDTFMYAFPHAYKNVPAAIGTVVTLIVSTEVGGQWNIVKNKNAWDLDKKIDQKATATVKIDPDTAWKLFSKSVKPTQAVDQVEISGNEALALQALQIVAVMA